MASFSMQIKHIEVYKVFIPFKVPIAHHLKKRISSESIVIVIHTKDGKIGYGEGTPRNYVTGESIDEVISFFEKACKDDLLPNIQNLEDIQNWLNDLANEYQMPAMITALEIALLDLWGQCLEASISALFNYTAEFSPKYYSAILPFLNIDKLDKWIHLIKSLEFKHIKIKVGQENDLKILQKVRLTLGEDIDIRLDANRAWTPEEAVYKIQQFESLNISCIEEPLQECFIDQLPELSRKINTPLMLDESVTNLPQAQYYTEQIQAKKLVFNLKISKFGGLLALDKIHQFAHDQGIACQLGCNVGETAILSAAGRIFAQSHELKYLEGAYAPFFMVDDLGRFPMSFSKEGKYHPLKKPGLGIQIDALKLKKYAQLQTILY